MNISNIKENEKILLYCTIVSFILILTLLILTSSIDNHTVLFFLLVLPLMFLKVLTDVVYTIFLFKSEPSTLVKILTWLLAVTTAGYMIPTALATQFEHKLPMKMRIGWLNLLLGWTVIGWWILLFLAINKREDII